MPELIDTLPGVDLPVGEVTGRLADMWPAGPGDSPSEFRAVQMNLVLHFGLGVAAEEARACFDAAIRFSQKHPSRIIVLCPVERGDDGHMAAKLFSQCYIGRSHREMCCCEALILSYKSNDFGYLANQVSVWLESDLPTCHWLHRVPAERIRKYANNLLKGVRRIVYDSSVEPAEVAALDWPEPQRVRDLAEARLLPVRQALGQFLSGYPVAELRRGLESVSVAHADGLAGEGRRLVRWLADCLGKCGTGEDCEGEVRFELETCEDRGCDCALAVEWAYHDERYFRWRMLKDRTIGDIEAAFGGFEGRVPTQVKSLRPEEALSEAFFF
jgi:hypothetical protein